MSIELKKEIESALKAFDGSNLRDCSINLLNILGYNSGRRINIDSNPVSFLGMLKDYKAEGFDEIRFKKKSLFDQWESASLLFQITDDDLSRQQVLFDSDKVDGNFLKSYVFFAVALSGKDYPRGKLANIARQINRVFPMPVMVLLHYDGKITIAIINRRADKRKQLDRDVLEKVTLIKDIVLRNPHRAHVEILFDLSIQNLSKKNTLSGFDDLHKAWTDILNIEALNKRFYRRIQEWFFWAAKNVSFPHGGIDDDDLRNRTALIRLLTRIVFCWFAKEKGLIPSLLFDNTTVKRALKNFDGLSLSDGGYYKAILQNLFFPTLGVPLDLREFRNGRRYKGTNKHYMRHEFFRHETLFNDPEELGRLFSDIPFLNGGLFECLDSGTCKDDEIRVDGFSDVAKNQPFVPNILFFGRDIEADLRESYGSDKKDSVKIDGLFAILDAYKFTIVENTPIEEEIALDPELLGRIFENLLAEYNPDTKLSARKQTGSFYTPREIVNYMVDESLRAYLKTKLTEKKYKDNEKLDEGLDRLLGYTEKEHPFEDIDAVNLLIDAIYDIKILDPACGSGAFPMGMLQKLVYVLEKLDLGHERWKQRILDETPAEMLEDTRKLLERSSADHNWKLGLILHSIYGVDIQPIAVQIAKLRCFISLLADSPVDEKEENKGVPALPNLDFKFVAANTLIKAPSEIERDGDELKLEDPFFKKFDKAAETYFFVRDPEEKWNMREDIVSLIDGKIMEKEKALFNNLSILGGDSKEIYREEMIRRNKSEIEKIKCEIELWESYRNIFSFRNKHVQFFDIKYFFPEAKDGFDIVLGNPPYVPLGKLRGNPLQKAYKDQKYDVHDSNGDIYCLFYERGLKVLHKGGYLCFITSNKWMRAGYGEKLRKFFIKYNPVTLIDMGPGVFDATVDTNILIIQNADNQKRLLAVTYKETELPVNEYVAKNALELKNLSKDAWFIGSDAEQKLKEKIEKIGKPLKEWEVKINYGIKTGLNEAFIIDTPTKERLCSEDPKSAEILKPILRGRDIKRYCYEWAGLWLIATGFDIDVPKKYPAIYKHLLQFEEKAGKRDDQGQNWYNLRACAYYPEFEKEKIIYPNMTKYLPFIFDDESFYTNQKCFIITGKRLRYLTGIFNSKISHKWIRENCPELQGGTRELSKIFFENIPIPPITPENRPVVEKIEKLADEILKMKRKLSSADTSELERQIDKLVYGLYGLTEEEIAIVEGKK